MYTCVCVLYSSDRCCWCRADSAWLLGVSSSKQAGCQWREEGLRAKAFGICMGIIPVLGAGQGPADPRLLFLTKTIIIPLQVRPLQKGLSPLTFCGPDREGQWGLVGNLIFGSITCSGCLSLGRGESVSMAGMVGSAKRSLGGLVFSWEKHRAMSQGQTNPAFHGCRH